MSSIAERVAGVRARIDAAARAVGRDPAAITIVAATKTRTVSEIDAVVAAGISDLGENRVQDWLAKRDAVEGQDLRWHLLGALQRNKVSKVVGAVHLVHGLTDLKVAEAIDRRARTIGVVQAVLLEVNTSRQATKAGVSLDEAPAAARRIAALEGLRLAGYFTVASMTDPEACFERLARLRELLRPELPQAIELSMGMSDDLEAGIAHGATLVRPGTALFGARPAMP